MTIVKELNELAEKMTGTNPGARTDAQALNYIEQHYTQGDGSSSGPVIVDFGDGFWDRYLDSGEKVDTNITNENDLQKIQEFNNALLQGNTAVLYSNGVILYPNLVLPDPNGIYGFDFMYLYDGRIIYISFRGLEEGDTPHIFVDYYPIYKTQELEV